MGFLITNLNRGIVLIIVTFVLIFTVNNTFASEKIKRTDLGLLYMQKRYKSINTLSKEVMRGFQSHPLNKNAFLTTSDEWQAYPLYGGEMTSIAIDPVDPLTVYVGTRDAGVFKTIDGGQTWLPARNGLTFYPIRSLVIDPADANILYAGTGNDGIWKSTDGGASWFKSSNGLYEGLSIFNIIINPKNTNIIYAGLGGGIGYGCGNIYKSVDSGANWERKDSGIPPYGDDYTEGAIFSLTIDPIQDSLVYAGTNMNGVFKSIDSGENWTALNDSIPDGETVNALAIDPYHSNRLSAIIGGEYYIYNNYWQKINEGIYFTNCGLFTDYLYFHPTDPSIIYSAGSMFTKSIDGGKNWTQYLGWNDSGKIPEIAFHPSTPGTIYAASAPLWEYTGGVYKSIDQGENWTLCEEGIKAAVIKSVTFDPQNSDYIYAGDNNGHIYRSENGGSSWYDTYTEGSGIDDIVVDPQNSQVIYAVDGSDLYYSSDRGESFNIIDSVESANCITIASNASSPIYAGCHFGNGIYKSSDGGQTWIQKNNSLPTFGSDICPILSIAIDPNDTSIVWTGTQYGGGIVKTTNGGDLWQVMGLTNENLVNAIAVDPDNSQHIIAGAGYSSGKIYTSDNGGADWQERVSDISFVMDIKFDPYNSQLVYAATEGYGVLRSFDGGENWQTYSNGIYYPVLYSLAVARKDSTLLLAGSYGSGLYWIYPSSIPDAVEDDLSKDYYPKTPYLEQNYPNPFNPITSINYHLSAFSYVMVDVYDILGRKVAVLVNEKKKPGNYKVMFNGNKLASGIYYYQIKTGSFVQTRKMILMR